MTWECAILKTYASLGGKAYDDDIYKNVGNFYRLTAEHLRIDPRYGDREMYKHTVRKFISMLAAPKRAELRQIDTGLYELTAKGRSRSSSC